jgi:TPR repeat protein
MTENEKRLMMKKALDYLEKAALKDAANAQMSLYVMMWEKAQTDEERTNALFWLWKAVEQNVPSALYEIGALYYHGLVYKKDLQKAHDYFREAAETLEGFETITDLDDTSLLIPDFSDKEARSDIFLLNHRLQIYNQVYPMSHHNIGVMCQQGLGVEMDASTALYHFMLAAEDGYGPSCLQAGSMLYTGEGVAQDKEKGLSLLDDLMTAGNVSAIKAKEELCEREGG